MKKKRNISRILCLLVLAFYLTACTSIVQEEPSKTLVPTKEENVPADVVVEINSSKEALPTQEITSPCAPSESFEKKQNTVAPKVKMVAYEGDSFVKSVFAVGDDCIYICGLDTEEKYFLAGMTTDETTFQKYNLDIPENMRVFRMAVDHEGRCHALWMSVENVVIGDQTFSQLSFQQGYITIMDITGNIEATIDISSIIEQKQINPFRFVVDFEGNYYIDHQDEILKITNTGELIETIFCEGIVESIGIGSSGKIYSIYSKENDILNLGYVEDKKVVYCAEVPRFESMYTNLCPGLDCELLLYNKAGGILTFESNAAEAELKISGTDLPITGQKVVGYGFLGDGRLCLLGQENGITEFYYVSQ